MTVEQMKMGDPKPLASLSSSLLARKGQAAPAMRRQSMMLSGINGIQPENDHAPLEDLGWNDMGDTHDEPVRQATGLSPMPQLAPSVTEQQSFVPMAPVEPPAVVRQQVELERELTRPVVPAAPVVEAAPVAEPAPVVEAAPAAPAPAFVEAPRVEQARVEHAPKAPVQRAAPGSRGKAAFTLRLDADRHLKLRLVCAVSHRSAQQIVTQALDEFLANQPSANELASRGGSN